MDTENQPKKNRNTVYDFIIIGQGIAGSVLALSLMQAGFKILVINDNKLSACSRVAAGIWNPVVFKRLTQSWLAKVAIAELRNFYTYAENLFQKKIMHSMPVLKPFTEEQEKIFWMKKASEENNFLDNNLYQNFNLTKNIMLNSYSKVLNSGYISVGLFLENTTLLLKNQNRYIEETTNYAEVIVSDDNVQYKNFEANKIIFCEGHLITQNPFFNWVRMKPAKGEILIIFCEGLLLKDNILNKGIFILPLGENKFKVGATYNWNDLTDTPTEPAKDELIKKLDRVIGINYKIIGHEAGIRPSVEDRRPVVGKHPLQKNVYCFNGFGTKSIMLAPYFAKQMINAIQNNTTLPEVDPARFYINTR